MKVYAAFIWLLVLRNKYGAVACSWGFTKLYKGAVEEA